MIKAHHTMPDDNNDKPKSTLTLGSSTLHLSVTPATGAAAVKKRKPASGVQVEVVGAKRRANRPATEGPAQAALGGLTPKEQEARLRALKLAEEQSEQQKAQKATEAANAQALRSVPPEENAFDAAPPPPPEEAEEARSETAAAETPAAVAAQETAAATTAAGFELTKKTRKLLEQLQAEKEEENAEKTAVKTKPTAPGASKKRSGRITVTQVLREEANSDDQASLGSGAPRKRVKRRGQAPSYASKDKIARDVQLPEHITVQDLALRMAERSQDVVRALMKMGVLAAQSQSIDADTAELVIEEFGHRVKRIREDEAGQELFNPAQDAEEALRPRAPVVTFMGHVDHGKTSLLDAIRESKVASGEAGGITQHIGAYQVSLPQGNITFLDTPGHEAFTEMRKRGANATDIVVLVVAADDGIMKQTEEAISHARAAGVPVVVAINKIDKPEANAHAVRTRLLSYELASEDMGGDVMTAEVSAKTGQGIDRLLECILLQAEVMELKANPDRSAVGVVIESRLDKSRGPVSTVLVQRGTLRVGDILVSGKAYGRVRAMSDAGGGKRETAGPSDAVEVLGLNDTPMAGARIAVASNERAAREVVDRVLEKERLTAGAAASTVKSSVDLLLEQFKGNTIRELPVVLKADVQGSLEAIEQSLLKFNNNEVAVRILHKGVGGITESDVALAGASSAIVIGFNVRADKAAKEVADRDKTSVQYYSIIYDLIDDVKSLLSGMLKPLVRENTLGTAEIRDVFSITRAGKVAGCYVTSGVIKRGAHTRLLRDNVVIHDGKLKALRRFKDDVAEVANGYECGMSFERYEDIKVGDVIEAYELIEEQRTI
jgi:translation initiation factor IF-2